MHDKKIHPQRDPLKLFKDWYAKAQEIGLRLPDAMTLATATKKGAPSARVILYKGIGRGGFRIFTNFNSRKAKELTSNPQAALVFYWEKLNRQIRVEGEVKRMTRAQSITYFKTRPRGSQLGAWASDQSAEIQNRAHLDQKLAEFEKKYAGKEVPCPAHWGGFLLIPSKFEFWIDRENRLHDRLVYTRVKKGWKISHLAP